jgi:hypothetical protein
MLIHAHERVPIAQLLQFLEHGEHLAHDCARAQAALVPDAAMRRFLRGQARQEFAHSLIFQSAVAWLGPGRLIGSPMLPPLERYRSLIDAALGRQDVAETFLAEQIILEGLGEAILKRIEEGLIKRGAAFGRLRRILLHQEAAHHDFGQRALARMLAGGEADIEVLRARAPEYLTLAEQMVMTLRDLFGSIDEDPAAWAADIRTYVPEWL